MRPLICSLILALALLPSVVRAAQPGIPEAFHGRTTGAVGAAISAAINDVVVASTTVASGGTYGYAPHIFLIPDPGNARRGATISFLIGTTSVETALFTNGAITALDLLLPGTTLESTTTSIATTTATSTPPSDSDTSTTTITVASTTAAAASSSGGSSGGSSGSSGGARAPSESTTHLSNASSARAQPAAPLYSPPQEHAKAAAPTTPEDARQETQPASPSAYAPSFPLAAAAALATEQGSELFLILLMYAAAAGFFAYALRLRLRRIARG